MRSRSIEWAVDPATLREQLAPAGSRLATVWRRVDGWEIPGWAREELVRWAAHLGMVRGYRVKTTVAVYVDRVGRWLAFAASRGWDAADVDGRQWETWLQHLAMSPRKHLSAAARRQYVRAVRGYYDWRHRMDLGANCAASLIAPRAVVRKARKYTRPQLQAMLRVVSDDSPQSLRDRALLLMLVTTGLRREECAELTLGAVEMRDRVAVVRVVGKGAREREIAIEGPVVTTLREWLVLREQMQCTHDRLWCSVARASRAKPIGTDAIEHMVGRVAKAAGLTEWGVHRFRVTFATMLYDDGEDIERIRRLMGHGSIETTRRYLDVSERNRGVRLSAMRQHEILGTRPVGLPAWAAIANPNRKGETDAPF